MNPVTSVARNTELYIVPEFLERIGGERVE